MQQVDVASYHLPLSPQVDEARIALHLAPTKHQTVAQESGRQFESPGQAAQAVLQNICSPRVVTESTAAAAAATAAAAAAAAGDDSAGKVPPGVDRSDNLGKGRCLPSKSAVAATAAAAAAWDGLAGKALPGDSRYLPYRRPLCGGRAKRITVRWRRDLTRSSHFMVSDEGKVLEPLSVASTYLRRFILPKEFIDSNYPNLKSGTLVRVHVKVPGSFVQKAKEALVRGGVIVAAEPEDSGRARIPATADEASEGAVANALAATSTGAVLAVAGRVGRVAGNGNGNGDTRAAATAAATSAGGAGAFSTADAQLVHQLEGRLSCSASADGEKAECWRISNMQQQLDSFVGWSVHGLEHIEAQVWFTQVT